MVMFLGSQQLTLYLCRITGLNDVLVSLDLHCCCFICTLYTLVFKILQNGMVVQFDMRQTMRPVESITGLTDSPIHTVHSLSADSTVSCGVKGVLTASSVGLCHWDFGRSGGR